MRSWSLSKKPITTIMIGSMCKEKWPPSSPILTSMEFHVYSALQANACKMLARYPTTTDLKERKHKKKIFYAVSWPHAGSWVWLNIIPSGVVCSYIFSMDASIIKFRGQTNMLVKKNIDLCVFFVRSFYLSERGVAFFLTKIIIRKLFT